MYKEFKSSMMGACNSCSVESRDHFKNGVSPKNQRSRRNFKLFKYALLFIAGLAICSISCKKDDKQGGDGGNFVIEAADVIVVSGDDYDVVTVGFGISGLWGMFIEVATGKYVTGEFKLTLKSPPTAEVHISGLNEKVKESVNVSNPDVRMTISSMFIAYDEKGSHIGYFRHIGKPSDKDVYDGDVYDGDVVVCYVYVDRDCTMTGTFEYAGGEATFDWSLKKGWNISYVKKTVGIDSDYVIEVLTTQKPSNFNWNWYYYDKDYWKDTSATKNRHFVEILNPTDWE